MFVKTRKKNELRTDDELKRIREIIKERLDPDVIMNMKTEKVASRISNNARLNGFTPEQLKTQFNM